MSRGQKTRCNNTWTEARYFGFIRSALRRAFTRYPIGHVVKNTARRPYTGPNKRQKYEYQCDLCREWYSGKETQVDHIEPCGTLRTFADLAGFVERLFCEPDGLRVLCIDCHKQVTAEQKQETKERAH